MSRDLGILMVILKLLGCFDIRAREWPLRKLDFLCKTLQDGGGEEMPVDMYTCRRDGFKREMVCFQKA